ncbi:MAG: LIM domain-containing protein [Candidatus Edwardsbacteria bacterium]|nr:LIM domain-containing protein [Candidatus Edwardsbacteria bacterium]
MKKIICVVIFLLIAIPALSAGADNLKCAACGRVINKTKHYLEYDGKTYCSQPCFEAALPKCATCGRVVGGGKEEGEFFKHKGKLYCSQACFEEALPKCAVCGKPVNGGILSDGKAYCSQECHRTTLPPCALCGRIMEKWMEIDSLKYCDGCAKLPRCYNCQHPGADIKLSDGRVLCKACNAVAVFDTVTAQNLFGRVRQDMRTWLGLATDDTIVFHLVDGAALSKVSGVSNFSERGFYQYRSRTRVTSSVKKVISQNHDIYVLTGIVPDHFKDVAAHELAHDYQVKHYPKLKDRADKEGFAEYVASLMATAWGNERLNQERLKNEFKDYVAGYQKMAKIAQQGGLPAVLEYLKKLNRGAK